MMKAPSMRVVGLPLARVRKSDTVSGFGNPVSSSGGIHDDVVGALWSATTSSSVVTGALSEGTRPVSGVSDSVSALGADAALGGSETSASSAWEGCSTVSTDAKASAATVGIVRERGATARRSVSARTEDPANASRRRGLRTRIFISSLGHGSNFAVGRAQRRSAHRSAVGRTAGSSRRALHGNQHLIRSIRYVTITPGIRPGNPVFGDGAVPNPVAFPRHLGTLSSATTVA